MRKIDLTLSLVAALVLGCAGLAFAQKGPPPANAPGVEVTLTGQNICLGCALKADKGAGAQCEKYGHKHVFKVATAVVGGSDMPNMAGMIFHYLETAGSADLIKGRHNETLKIVGKGYPYERTLEVVSVAAAEAEPEHPEHPKGAEHPEHPKK